MAMQNNHNKFDVISTDIRDLKVIRRKPVTDSRGYLERMFCINDLACVMAAGSIVQINRTHTKQLGAVRGMHYQLQPCAEIKLVTCLKGRVFDVAVDLRANSPTFLKSFAIELTENNHTTLLIPKGFAHGFQTLTADCEMLYFHSTQYSPVHERGLNVLDPLLGIEWPLPITDRSPRDLAHPMLTANFQGIDL